MNVKLLRGNITDIPADAIVNAANKALMPGGGVDGAITTAAGQDALQARLQIGGCNIGDAVAGPAGNLPAKYIIYAVGPRYTDKKPHLLFSAYRRAMEVALENDCKSISFPAISAGVYGYPSDLATDIAVDAINEFTDHEITVNLVAFTDEVYEGFKKALETYHVQFDEPD